MKKKVNDEMSAFEQLYKDHESVWGKEPDEWLKMFARKITQKGKVLEIGVGEGRDAIWMAKQGFEVEGIDSAETGIEKAQKMAGKRKIGLSCVRAQDFNYEKEKSRLFILDL